jgi:hypothetical protein
MDVIKESTHQEDICISSSTNTYPDLIVKFTTLVRVHNSLVQAMELLKPRTEITSMYY